MFFMLINFYSYKYKMIPSVYETIKLFHENKEIVNAYLRGDNIEHFKNPIMDTLGTSMEIFVILLIIQLIFTFLTLYVLYKHRQSISDGMLIAATFVTIFVPGGALLVLLSVLMIVK